MLRKIQYILIEINTDIDIYKFLRNTFNTIRINGQIIA